MKIKIDVSVSELIDKITILELKQQNIKDKNKLKNICYELNKLNKIKSKLNLSEEIHKFEMKLKLVNSILWNIEDRIREKEKHKLFDDEFIKLSRDVYINNDQRASIKREIDTLVNSDIIEEKSYDSYI